MTDSERMGPVDAELAHIQGTFYEQHLAECEADDWLTALAKPETALESFTQVDVVLLARELLALRAEVAELQAKS